MQENFYQELDPKVIFTDGDFKEFGESRGYTFGQVPYHRGRKHFLKFLIGKIPEWRGCYSKKWLSKEIPQAYKIVISFVYSPITLLWGHWISTKKKCRHIVHIADHCDLFLEPRYLAAISSATSLLVISKKMKVLYEKETNRKDIKVFHNFPDNRCFPKKDIVETSDISFSYSSPLIVTFIGGLYESLHKRSIEDIILAISQLRKAGSPIELHFYGQRSPKSFLKEEIASEGIVHHGLVLPLDKKYEIMRNAHAFIVPSSFDSEINKDYQHSFPTKLTEFIATAKPILYYGPSNTETNDFLEGIKGATLINEESIDLLTKHFQYLIKNYAQKKTDAMQDSMQIRLEHNMDETLLRFHNHLSEVSM